MTPRLAALAVLGLLIAVPLAAAVAPALDAPADAPAARGDEGTVEEVERAATSFAGLSPAPSPVSPIDVPLDGLAWNGGLVTGAIAVAGLASLAGFAFFRGGSRFMTPAQVLENEVRRRIYGHLKAHVGANLKQVTDDLGLTTTNAIWHLRKLEEAGVVHSRRFNGYKVFYPAEGGVAARKLSLGKTALANENAQDVFSHVVHHPGSHQREIARALGVNHGTVRWHLRKLMDAELIVETRRGKASSYVPTDAGLDAMREVGRDTRRAPVAVLTAA